MIDFKKLEAVLVACEFSHEHDDGCHSCGYGATKSCPICCQFTQTGEPKERHFKNCALAECLTAVREMLANGSR
jgi:hypothetical protein